jgi:hypothetical protein
VVQFGLAGPVKVHGQDGSPSPDGSNPPTASEPPHGTERPSSGDPSGPPPTDAPAPEAPIGDGLIDVGPADHLIALGINTPLEFQVETVSLSRLEDARITPVPVVRLPTLWESTHFIVIAPEDPRAVGQPAIWEAGVYRLELTTTFGDVRIVDLRVLPPIVVTASPSLDPVREVRPPFR